MKINSLLLTLALVFSVSMAQAADDAKKLTNENGVAFIDSTCLLMNPAKRLVFADSDVDILSSGMMLKTRERVLLVKLTARSGLKQSGNMLLFLKRVSSVDRKSTYSFDTKLGATLAVEEDRSEDGRLNIMKIRLIEESGTTETSVACSDTFGN